MHTPSEQGLEVRTAWLSLVSECLLKQGKGSDRDLVRVSSAFDIWSASHSCYEGWQASDRRLCPDRCPQLLDRLHGVDPGLPARRQRSSARKGQATADPENHNLQHHEQLHRETCSCMLSGYVSRTLLEPFLGVEEVPDSLVRGSVIQCRGLSCQFLVDILELW